MARLFFCVCEQVRTPLRAFGFRRLGSTSETGVLMKVVRCRAFNLHLQRLYASRLHGDDIVLML